MKGNIRMMGNVGCCKYFNPFKKCVQKPVMKNGFVNNFGKNVKSSSEDANELLIRDCVNWLKNSSYNSKEREAIMLAKVKNLDTFCPEKPKMK